MESPSMVPRECPRWSGTRWDAVRGMETDKLGQGTLCSGEDTQDGCEELSVVSLLYSHMSVTHLPLVHAWNYRRCILANMPTSRNETSELAYTYGKIKANFSNFSAWHQRSKTLAVLWESGQLDPVQSKDDGACTSSIRL